MTQGRNGLWSPLVPSLDGVPRSSWLHFCNAQFERKLCYNRRKTSVNQILLTHSPNHRPAVINTNCSCGMPGKLSPESSVGSSDLPRPLSRVTLSARIALRQSSASGVCGWNLLPHVHRLCFFGKTRRGTIAELLEENQDTTLRTGEIGVFGTDVRGCPFLVWEWHDRGIWSCLTFDLI